MESGIPRGQQPQYRPWGRRIKENVKARWPGYPLIIGLVIISWVVGHEVEARDRFFIERDPSLSYPYEPNTVPDWTLAFIGGLGPAFLIVFTQVLIRRSPRGVYFDRRIKDIHLAIIVLGEVLTVTWLITNLLKVYVGKLRPNFFAYCDYAGYREALASGDFSFYEANTVAGRIGDYSKCNRRELDSRLTFPSGHASISFCGLTFLTLFLLHVTSRISFTHHAVGKILRFFILLIPLFSGALVCATRIIDYRHFTEDTIWGALIGILGAMLAFHANYSYVRPSTTGIPVHGGQLEVPPHIAEAYFAAHPEHRPPELAHPLGHAPTPIGPHQDNYTIPSSRDVMGAPAP